MSVLACPRCPSCIKVSSSEERPSDFELSKDFELSDDCIQQFKCYAAYAASQQIRYCSNALHTCYWE